MLELIDTQDCAVSVAAVDKKGKPATVQSPVWASTDATVATVTQDAVDPLKAAISAQAPGVAQITCTADADLGDGVTSITANLDLSVIGGQATGFVITPGTPTEQP